MMNVNVIKVNIQLQLHPKILIKLLRPHVSRKYALIRIAEHNKFIVVFLLLSQQFVNFFSTKLDSQPLFAKTCQVVKPGIIIKIENDLFTFGRID